MTVTTSSMIVVFRTSGINPAPIPWILCGPGLPPERIGESAGSTATALKEGLRDLMTSETPVMVPPVPTPEIKISIWPPVSDQISSAVVLRCISGLAGLANWFGM